MPVFDGAKSVFRLRSTVMALLSLKYFPTIRGGDRDPDDSVVSCRRLVYLRPGPTLSVLMTVGTVVLESSHGQLQLRMNRGRRLDIVPVDCESTDDQLRRREN